MTEKKPMFTRISAFKKLLEKVAKVPKREIDEKESEYQRERRLSSASAALYDL